MSELIAAAATGPCLSAIGIVRLSGDGAARAADAVFRRRDGGSMTSAEPRRLYYGELRDRDGRTIDLCLCTVSFAPHSYTGEDTAEFQCHGSPTVIREALEALFAAGARQAGPGEFTKRAFLNGRMDLTQAEAVIDLIESETPAAARNAAAQLSHSIGRKLDGVYSALVDMMARFHAVLDYPDEEIDDMTAAEYVRTLGGMETELTSLLATCERGKVLRSGVRCAIIGRPNTGKSSLLNALLGYERAIVTDVAGTTRDTIEEKAVFGGTLLRLCDTAGIRATDDAVEKLGIERARSAAAGAQLVFAVLDGSEPLTEDDMAILAIAEDAPHAAIIINKQDKAADADMSRACASGLPVFRTSAATGEGLDALADHVAGLFERGAPPDGEILTNARQAEAVRRAVGDIRSAADALAGGVTPDAALTGVESALEAIASLTGRSFRADTTARIFERFCVGK